MSESIRFDPHVHSSASHDCKVEPEQVAGRCRRLGLSPIFITDHNTVVAAASLQALGDHDVVAGEEVMTTDGELIGLFLQSEVPAGLTPRETALRIRGQGGLVYVEHPYDPFRRHLTEASIEAIADLIDIVEVFNGRSAEKANRLAADLCGTLGVAPGAGSDAHTLREIGSVFVQMEDFEGPPDFLAKLRTGRIVSGRNKFLLPPRRG